MTMHASDCLFELPVELVNKNPKGSVIANQEINYLVKSVIYAVFYDTIFLIIFKSKVK